MNNPSIMEKSADCSTLPVPSSNPKISTSDVIDLTESDSFNDSGSVISDSSKSIISDSEDEESHHVSKVFSPVFNMANKTLGMKMGSVPFAYKPKLNIPAEKITQPKPAHHLPVKPVANKTEPSIANYVVSTAKRASQYIEPKAPSVATVTLQSSDGRAVHPVAPKPFLSHPVQPLIIKKSSPPFERPGNVSHIIPIIKPSKTMVKPLINSPVIEIEDDDENDNAERQERAKLSEKILTLKEKINQASKALAAVNLDTLPDKGLRLQMQLSNLKLEHREAHKKYQLLNAKMAPQHNVTNNFNSLPVGQPQPYRRPGTIMVAESLTGDALVRLHSSLRNCPLESGLTDEGPQGLTVPLMPHQKRAMAWLLWREKQHPKGGILADDMGLGKTLTMLALILRSKELNQDDQENLNQSGQEDRKLPRGGTLVVCPASVLRQWESEIKDRCERKKLTSFVYHGNNRPDNISRLLRKDVVITTYNLVAREGEIPLQHLALDGLQSAESQGMLFSIKWDRVILDEAHQVRNPKTKMAKGVCNLHSNFRWALTGTPIHNKLLDLYSLIKFLNFTPFNNEQVWRRCAENKTAMGTERLNTIMKTIMLRRTKQELQQEGQLKCLPKKQIETIEVTLQPEEDQVYQHLLKKSKTLMAKFMMQRAEKMVETGENPFAVDQAKRQLEEQGITMQRGSRSDEKVKASHILLQLLRLRQICCHTALVKSKIDEETVKHDDMEDGDDFMNMVQNMNKLGLEDEEEEEECNRLLDPNNPVYNHNRVSSKIDAVLNQVLKIKETGEKVVLVSQWTSMLDIVDAHLRRKGIHAAMFTGKIDAQKRQGILDSFNKSNSGPQVLLLSLTAGGVGVNLIGGNHLVLMDIHWNPQLEAQAMDRVFRVGQKRDVKIYKFICAHTVEQSIQLIQEKKLRIADGILKAKSKTKLDFEDLKSLFLSI